MACYTKGLLYKILSLGPRKAPRFGRISRKMVGRVSNAPVTVPCSEWSEHSHWTNPRGTKQNYSSTRNPLSCLLKSSQALATMATQLIPLPEVERLSASVVRILGGNPGKFTLQGTNTYLIGRGRQRILIDTGEGERSWATSLKTVLSEENATVQQVLLTHWHGDHIGGVSDLKRLCPQAIVHKHDPEDGQEDIYDGQVFCVEGATLKACHTPGHTYDHMAFIIEEEDALITGDNVLGHGTSVFEDLQAYLASLQRMRTRASGRGYPGHGPMIEKVTTRIAEYLQHRQQREDEVIRVLRYGSLDVDRNGGSSSPAQAQQEKEYWTPLELVKKIYRDVPESLHLPASHGVLQVLMKLEDEGKTVHDSTSGGWSLKTERSAL